jgi:hypothetical protein
MTPKKMSTAAVLIGLAALLPPAIVSTEPVQVRHVEGLVHGFLALRTLEGAILADGDLTQTSRGDQVTTRLAFHFKDGSLQDETTTFSQRGRFRLLRDHLIQKGAAFDHPLEMSIDAASGQVTVQYRDEHGAAKTLSEHFDLPPDIANGLVPTLLKNVGSTAIPLNVSMIAATPKPRLVKLAISSAGIDSFTIAGSTRRATHYIAKVEIGGIAGVLAPILGKEPPDVHVWILGGETPAFVKSEGPLFYGGRPWRLELASPVWPKG